MRKLLTDENITQNQICGTVGKENCLDHLPRLEEDKGVQQKTAFTTVQSLTSNSVSLSTC